MKQSSLNMTNSLLVPEKVEPKKKVKKPSKGPKIQSPPVDMVLRYPIEVWVSAGEQFVKPESKTRKLKSQ